ncbi:hypothetical protein MMC28_009036, partial [Mycoblastus sanguinarius]|nr:hypothetical protein [Mycoblastus sanguinarius]
MFYLRRRGHMFTRTVMSRHQIYLRRSNEAMSSDEALGRSKIWCGGGKHVTSVALGEQIQRQLEKAGIVRRFTSPTLRRYGFDNLDPGHPGPLYQNNYPHLSLSYGPNAEQEPATEISTSK